MTLSFARLLPAALLVCALGMTACSTDGGEEANGPDAAIGPGGDDGDGHVGRTSLDALVGGESPAALPDPTVTLTIDGNTRRCAVTAATAPPAGTSIVFAFSRNGGPFAAMAATTSLSAAEPGAAKGCDLLRCRATVGDGPLAKVGESDSAHLPMADECGAGCWSCAASGGCETATDACDDGDACTSGDSCASGKCAGQGRAGQVWYADKDKDGYGGLLFSGNACGVPDAARRRSGGYVQQAGDCDDDNPAAFPGAEETCDGIDTDCSGGDEDVCADLVGDDLSDFETDEPITGDQFDVGAKATVNAGPLGDVSVEGKVSKAGKDAPVTWCMTGKVGPAGPATFQDATIEVCKDAEGNISATVVGDATFDGQSAQVDCKLTLGAKSEIVCIATGLNLLGVAGSEATVVWAADDTALTIKDAEATLDYLGQQVAVLLSGQLTPGKDSSLTMALVQPGEVQLLGAAFTGLAQQGSGTLSRSGDLVSHDLKLAAAKLNLGGDTAIPADVFSIIAKRPFGGKWTLKIAGQGVKLLPLGILQIDGQVMEDDPLCASGATGITPPGAAASAQAQVCFQAGAAPAWTLQAAIEVPPFGQANISAPWQPGNKQICLKGPTSASLPPLNAGLTKSPLLASSCLTLANKSFGAVGLLASIPLPPLGQVELSGQLQGESLCLDGDLVINIGGKPLTLAVQACTDVKLSQLKATVGATVALPPFGTLPTQATLDGKAKTLCLSATVPAKVGFAATDVSLVAGHCIAFSKDASGTTVASAGDGPGATLTVTHPGLGTFSMSGHWDADKVAGDGSKGVLCVSGALPSKAKALIPLPGVAVLASHGTTCWSKGGFDTIALGTTLRVGAANSPSSLRLLATGGLDAAGGACAAKATTSQACSALNKTWQQGLNNPAKGADPRYHWLGSSCYDSHSTHAAGCKSAGGTWKSDVAGRLELSLAPYCTKKGSSTCAWTASCDTGAGDTVCSQTWTPFAGMAAKVPQSIANLTFTQVGGYVLADKKSATLALDAVAEAGGQSGKLTLVKVAGAPLLQLDKVGAHASVDSKGSFNVALSGESDLDLSAAGLPAWSLRTVLRASISDSGASFHGLVLPTSCNGGGACVFPAFEPFAPLLGKGALSVQSEGAELAFDLAWGAAAKAALTVQMRTAGTVKLLGNAAADVSMNVRAQWPNSGAGSKPQPIVTFAAVLKSFKVGAGAFILELGATKGGAGGLKTSPIVLLASSEAVEGLAVDTDGDLSNGTEATWDIPKGLTIRTAAEITHLAELFSNITAQLDLTLEGPTKFRIRGDIQTDWPLIKPEYKIPTLHSASIKTLFVDLEVATTVILKIGGTTQLVTLDRKGGQHALTGLAEFEVDSTSSIGGTIALTGLWQEPFYVPNLAVMDMGISLKLQPAVPPVPTALGFTGTGLLHKADFDAPWPKIAKDKQNNPVGVNPDGSLMAQLPASVLTIGNSFYLDTAPSPSGFCLGATCAPLPSLLIRMDRQNLSTDDLVWAVSQMQKGLATVIDKTKTMAVFDPITGTTKTLNSPFAAIAGRFPLNKPVTLALPDDVKVDLHRALVYLSTHDQSRFGLDWPFGFRMELDASMVVPVGADKGKFKKLRLQGAMDTAGVELHGRVSPLQVLKGMDLVADPFRKAASVPGNATLELPASLAAASAQTVELAIRGPAKGGASLLSTSKGARAVRLLESSKLYAPCPSDGALAPTAPDGSKVDCSKPTPALVLELQTDNSNIPAQWRKRTVRTLRGVRRAGSWQRLAYTVNAKGHVAIYVDGRSVPLVDSADGADGIAGTLDDQARFAAPAISAVSTVAGEAVGAVDDLRFWNVVRSAEAISRYLERPAKGAHNDSTLRGWYEVDFDEVHDKIAGVVVLRDSHLPGHHGRYLGGAQPLLDKADPDLRMDLSLPVINPLAAGMGFEAGLALALPAPLATLLGTPKLHVAARMHASKSLVAGRFYTRTLTVVPIPGIGGFVLSGDGPNGKSGDFDDGLWFEASFAPALDVSSEHLPTIDASARLGLDWQGSLLPIGQVTTRLGCLKKAGNSGAAFTGKPCSPGKGYHLFLETKAGADGKLTVPLGGKDALGLQGRFVASTLDVPFRLLAESGLSAFGRTLNKQTLLIDGKGITATGSFDLGPIGGVEFGTAASLAATFQWKPARLCATGKTQVDVPVLATFNGDVSACFGASPKAAFEGTAKVGKLGATSIPITDLAVSLSTSQGLLVKKARLVVPALYDGQLGGWFKTPTSFDVSGTSVVAPGGGALLRWTTTAKVQRNGASGGGSLLAKLDTSKSPVGTWASGTIAGAFQASGGKMYWGLAGNATLRPAGFKLASGRFWACNPKSTAAAGLPLECKYTANKGFGAKGSIDVGIAKVGVAGALKFGTKLGGKTVDLLMLQGKLNASIFKTFGVSGTVYPRLSVPAVSGYNGVRIAGKMSALGVSQNFNAALSAGSDGRPKSVSLSVYGNIKPYSSVTLTSGKAAMTWTPKKTTASAYGNIKIGSVLSTKVSTAIASNGSRTFKGTTSVRVAKLMKHTTAITLNSKGAWLNTTMKADTYHVDLSGKLYGTVPYNGKFSFGSTGGLKLGAFPTAYVGNFKSHYSKGISGTGSVNLKVVKMSVAASASPSASGIKVSGSQTYNWTIGNFNFPYVSTAVKYVAKSLSGWSCSSYCKAKDPVWGKCVLYWYKCSKKTTHNSYKKVGAKVSFSLSGTSYISSSTVKLKATATLNAGPVKGSSSTTCGIGTKPQCCFSFPSPVGKRCLKLY